MDDNLEIFVSQVAGSLPMLRDGRRGRVLKPAMEHELSFYVAIRDAPPASVAPILRFLPLFFGTKRVGLRDLRGLAQKCQDETFVRSQVQRDRQQREATVLGSSSAAAAETRGRSRTVSTLSDAATRDRSDSDGPGLFVVNDATQSAAQASSVRTAAAVSASSDSASLRIEAVASKPKTPFSIASLWGRLIDASATSKRVDRLISATTPEGETLIDFIAIEDLTHAMLEPNVMDLKLGTRQHSDGDSPDKIARKILRCAETTSGVMGVRISGVQCVWSATAAPASASSASSASAPSTSSLETSQFMRRKGKYWGRLLAPDGVRAALRDFVVDPVTGALRIAVVRRLLVELEELAAALRQMPWRWWSSSLLLAYDAADSAAAVAAAGRDDEEDGADKRGEEGGGGGSGGGARGGAACTSALVRLIDFAHVDMGADAPSTSPRVALEGPDEGALTGVETLLAVYGALLLDAGEGVILFEEN